MILVNKKTIQVLREYGRKTNPRYTEKLRSFSFVAIDGKYPNYSERLQPNEVLENIDKDPKQGFIDLYASIMSSRQDINMNGQTVKIEVLEDTIKLLGVHVIRKVVDGKVDKKYKMFDNTIAGSEFIARVDLLQKCASKLKPEDVNGTLVDHVCEKDGFSEIEKKAAAWMKKVFYRADYIFARRVLTYQIGGKTSTDIYWYIIGEDNSLAREQKIVSDEFRILPFSASSEVSEIIPR